MKSFYFQFLRDTSLLVHKGSLGRRRACRWRGWVEHRLRVSSTTTSPPPPKASLPAPWTRFRHRSGTDLHDPRSFKGSRGWETSTAKEPIPTVSVWEQEPKSGFWGRKEWLSPQDSQAPSSSCPGGCCEEGRGGWSLPFRWRRLATHWPLSQILSQRYTFAPQDQLVRDPKSGPHFGSRLSLAPTPSVSSSAAYSSLSLGWSLALQMP